MNFRAPAIPLITVDPFTQIWMRGDASTSTTSSHWDNQPKLTTGIITVDKTQSFQVLGSCTAVTPKKPLPATTQSGRDISPGSCDIINYPNSSEDECNMKCYGNKNCLAFVINQSDNNRCYLKSCAHPVVDSAHHVASIINPSNRTCANNVKHCKQEGVHIYPTRTIFNLNCDNIINLNVTFLQTLFTDDYVRLSRPVYYVDWSISSLDGKDHSADIFFSLSGEHVINSDLLQPVQWETVVNNQMITVRIGNSKQNILGSKGDQVNIDWGYMYLSSPSSSILSVWGGSVANATQTFLATGNLPTFKDNRSPRACNIDLPGISATTSMNTGSHQTFLVAYDDIASVNYFGDNYKGYWTQNYTSILDAMKHSKEEYDLMLSQSIQHDNQLLNKLRLVGGDEYSQLCSLSYRQTLAATKLVWNHNQSVVWNFLKEISTNGDMSTVDVIYPSSPMFLYTNSELLKLLLIPVLSYGNNQTYVKFTDPYSPHQLGTYPIADAPTEAQEPMPLENTGNMFFMLLGIVQQEKNDIALIKQYWPMLMNWANELILSLPYPANQLCTDDFTGKLANNTNLGAKGIIALEAFAELCRLSEQKNCEMYSVTAKKYANVWVENALSITPTRHYKMSYNSVPHVNDSWSIKYNMMWQKLLNLNGPFDYKNIMTDELKYYASKSNVYGVPMDPRHRYVKTDWLSWIAAMAGDINGIDDFHFFFDPIYKSVNETKDRNPFTDLYDTTNADQSMHGFIARPVIGGIFAHALMQEKKGGNSNSIVSKNVILPQKVNKPHFSGMFFAMTPAVTLWDVDSWVKEFQYMKRAGMSFVVIPHTGKQIKTSTPTCTNGTFQVYYPVHSAYLNPLCYTQIGNTNVDGGTLGASFAAAEKVGLNIHLGLLFAPAEHGFPAEHSNNTYLEWADQQYGAAAALYSLYGNDGTKTKSKLVGFYTEIESSNDNEWLNVYPNFSQHYWNRLGSQIKDNLSSKLQVWASPYSIGNLTRHPSGFANVTSTRVAWSDIFKNAPSLDFVAPQDSMGAQGNSFQNASDYLAAVVNGGKDSKRSVQQWSNVELFEVWPKSCQWPTTCHGRHPASFEGRIRKQIHNEAMILSPKDNGSSATLIAWEWRSCFSPNAFDDPHIPFPNITKSNYDAYLEYLYEEDIY
jgi:hypothetical protein